MSARIISREEAGKRNASTTGERHPLPDPGPPEQEDQTQKILTEVLNLGMSIEKVLAEIKKPPRAGEPGAMEFLARAATQVAELATLFSDHHAQILNLTVQVLKLKEAISEQKTNWEFIPERHRGIVSRWIAKRIS